MLSLRLRGMSGNETSPLVTLHLMFWPGLALALLGVLLAGTDGADEDFPAALCAVLVGAGATLVAIAVIGFGVMLGLRAASERRNG